MQRPGINGNGRYRGQPPTAATPWDRFKAKRAAQRLATVQLKRGYRKALRQVQGAPSTAFAADAVPPVTVAIGLKRARGHAAAFIGAPAEDGDSSGRIPAPTSSSKRQRREEHGAGAGHKTEGSAEAAPVKHHHRFEAAERVAHERRIARNAARAAAEAARKAAADKAVRRMQLSQQAKQRTKRTGQPLLSRRIAGILDKLERGGAGSGK